MPRKKITDKKASNSDKADKAIKKTAPAEGGIKKKKRRSRPSKVELTDFKQYKKVTDLLLNKAPFQRFFRRFFNGIPRVGCKFRFKPEALLSLQKASLGYIKFIAEHSKNCKIHGKEATDMLEAIYSA